MPDPTGSQGPINLARKLRRWGVRTVGSVARIHPPIPIQSNVFKSVLFLNTSSAHLHGVNTSPTDVFVYVGFGHADSVSFRVVPK